MGSPTQGFIGVEITKGSVQPSFTFPKDFSFLSVAIPFPDAFFRTIRMLSCLSQRCCRAVVIRTVLGERGGLPQAYVHSGGATTGLRKS